MSALLHFMRDFCRRPADGGKCDIFRTILCRQSRSQLSARLAVEGTPLWRYSGGVPFDETAWGETLAVGWEKKGSFPSLYHESGIYDKREVVICFLLASDMALAEADAMLDELSIRNQSYEVRRLYPLHFKEGFFRLVIAWNERHTVKLSFRQAVAAYQNYEAGLIGNLRQAWNVLKERYLIVSRYGGSMDDFRFAEYCHKLNMELWKRADCWGCPLHLAEQDELQRLIVLMAHEERALYEAANKSNTELLKRNRNTRPVSQRGTRLCQSVIDRCAKKEDWADASDTFLREAVSTMGEAYWRAMSWVMKAYGESGGRGGFHSPYVRERIYSVRNKEAKTAQAAPIFSQNPEQSSLSFSLDISRIKELIKNGSSNTVQIAELLHPIPRNSEEVFGQPDSDVPQTLLSLFLSSYQRWLEGKTNIQRQGERRTPMPFYDFKRETVLKYALACGCRSRIELNRCMEFAGYHALVPNNPVECLVQEALCLYEKMSYAEKKRISPISLLMDMQMYLLYFSVRDYWKEQGGIVDETAIRKRVRMLRKSLFYEPDIPELSTKGGPISKQSQIENFLTLCFLAMLALEYISQQRHPLDGRSSAAETVLAQWETGGEYWRDISAGFLLFMNLPSEAGTAYMIDRSNDPTWAGNSAKPKAAANVEYLSKLFQIAFQHMDSLENLRNSNSPIAKIVYESWFLILAMLSGSYGLEAIKAITAVTQFQKLLQDSAVLWTFWGGVRNFSITYYERRFYLNHFAKKHITADDAQKGRWLKYLHDMKEDIPIWEDILSDAKVIYHCFQYIQNDHLLPPRKLEAEYERFQSKNSEIYEILEQLEAVLAGGVGEEEQRLKKRLTFIKRQLSDI